MSKVCKNCGNIIGSDEKFCSKCGSIDFIVPPNTNTYAYEDESDQPTNYIPQNDYAYNMPQNNIYEEKRAKSKKWPLIIGLSGGGVVLLVAIILILSLIPWGYKGAIANIIDITNGKMDNYEKLAPQEYWDYYEKQTGKDVDDLIDAYEEERDEGLEEMEEQYGKDWKTSYKIIYSETINDKKMKKIAKSLEKKYEIDKDTVTNGYEVGTVIIIGGSEQKNMVGAELSVIQIDGQWYICSVSEYGGETNVNFIISAFGF